MNDDQRAKQQSVGALLPQPTKEVASIPILRVDR